MPLFKRAKHSGATIAAIFDIGNGSIGAALVYFSEDAPPLTFYSTRNVVTFQHIPDFEQLSKSVLSTFLDTVLALQEQGFPLMSQYTKKGTLDQVMCTFASPWAATFANHIVLKQEKPVTISTKQMNKILAAEEEKYNAWFKEYAHAERITTAPHMIERHVMQTTLNGYPTAKPQGKVATQIEFDLVLSAVPTGVYDETVKVVGQLVGDKRGVYHAFSVSTVAVLRDLFHTTSDFVFCDITSEITDINIVRNGAIARSTSMPKGKNFVIREVAAQLKTVPEEVPSLLTAYFAGEMSDAEAEAMQKLLDTIGITYLESLSETLAPVAAEIILPSTMFLSVDEQYGKFFEGLISEHNFGKFLFSSGSFNITRINNTLLQDQIAYADNVAFDPFLALESLFFNKISYNSDND